MKCRRINQEVLVAQDPIPAVGPEEIRALIVKSDGNPRQRIRICTHSDANDRIHEMLIVHQRGVYVPPHSHIAKTESFHVISGLADVVIFDTQGLVQQVIPIGDWSTGRKFFLRIPPDCIHSLRVLSDHFVFHETTSGPFRREDTLFPAWAPEESDLPGVARFMDRLAGQIDQWLAVHPARPDSNQFEEDTVLQVNKS